jgi:hypothetical protein
MSARFFPKALAAFAAGSLDWDAHNFKNRLVKLDGSLTDTAVKAIAGVTNASPAVFTVASTAGWTTGDLVVTRGILGNLSANQTALLQVINGATFSLKTLDGSRDVAGSAAYVSGGCVINLTLIDFRDDYDAAEVGTASANLAAKTNVDGTLDADDPTGMTLADTAHANIIYRDVGTAGTDVPVHFQDGKQVVTVAADAAISATTLWVEPLAGAMDSGETMVFSNGVTAQLSSAAAAGARSVAVTALPAAIAAGHQADVRTTLSGYPLTSGGGPVAPTFDSGPNKIGRL